MRFLLVFFFADELHADLVGRQAGYGRLLSVREDRPQGLPVLQSIHPLPSFWSNHFRKLMLFYSCCPSFSRRLFCILRVRQTHTLMAMYHRYVCILLSPFCSRRHALRVSSLTCLPLLPRKTHGHTACCMLPVCVFLAIDFTFDDFITASEWHGCADQR